MYRKTAAKLSIGALVTAMLLTPNEATEAQNASRQPAPLPVVQAYQAWVNQGIASRRLVRRCTFGMLDGIAYPPALPPTVARDGEKTVYGDINNDGITDFIAQVSSIDCGSGTAGWHGEFIVGVSQGPGFSFGREGDAVYRRYLGPIDAAAQRFGFLDRIMSIENGTVSGLFWDNNSRSVRGYCEGYHGNSNVRRSFQFDSIRGVLINAGPPIIDREWRCL